MRNLRFVAQVAVLSLIFVAGANTLAEGQISPATKEIPLVPPGVITTAMALALSQESIDQLPLDQQCRIQRLIAEANAGYPLDAFGCIWRRLALNTSGQADQYFGGFGIGNTIGLSVGDDQAALYTELLSDNMYLFSNIGYARVGFATQVSASDDSTRSTTVNQFFQGGGNAVLYAALPLRVRITYADDRDNPKPVRRFDSALTLAFGADVPKLSTPSTESAAYGRLGLQTAFTWRTADEDFRFFVLGNGGYTYGFNDKFYGNLSSDPDVDSPEWGILSGTATVGVDLAQIIRVGVRFSSSSFGPAQQKPQLAIQVLAK